MILSVSCFVIFCHVYPTKHEYFTHIAMSTVFFGSQFSYQTKAICFFSRSFSFLVKMWLSVFWVRFSRRKKKWEKKTSPIISFLVDSLRLGSPTYFILHITVYNITNERKNVHKYLVHYQIHHLFNQRDESCVY